MKPGPELIELDTEDQQRQKATHRDALDRLLATMEENSVRRNAELFAEWLRRYQADPSQFADMENAKTPEEYGELAARYFLKLEKDFIRGAVLKMAAAAEKGEQA